MEIENLKVGDVIYIRDDINDSSRIGSQRSDEIMLTGVQQISKVDYNNYYFEIVGEIDKPWIMRNSYTVGMIDLDKTIALENAKKNNLKGDDIIKNNPVHPSHYDGGKHGIECYKAIEYILDRLVNVPEKYYGHVSNVIKYIWRCNNKNGYEDLDKARVYLEFMFEEE